MPQKERTVTWQFMCLQILRNFHTNGARTGNHSCMQKKIAKTSTVPHKTYLAIASLSQTAEVTQKWQLHNFVHLNTSRPDG